MKVKLNVSERLYAAAIINQFKGDFSTLAFLLEDVKNLPITEEEWKKAERKISAPDDKGNTTWTWNDEKGGIKEVELLDETKKYLVSKIEEKSKNGELTLNDRAAITLKKKLE